MSNRLTQAVGSNLRGLKERAAEPGAIARELLPGEIQRCLRFFNVEPDRLLIEITEGEMIDKWERSREFVRALKDIGVGYHGLEIHPVAVNLMHERGIAATQVDLSDLGAVTSALDTVDGSSPVGAGRASSLVTAWRAALRAASRTSWSSNSSKPAVAAIGS